MTARTPTATTIPESPDTADVTHPAMLVGLISLSWAMTWSWLMPKVAAKATMSAYILVNWSW